MDDIKVLDEKHLVTITNDYFKDSFGIYNKADITARYPKASIWTIYFINIQSLDNIQSGTIFDKSKLIKLK